MRIVLILAAFTLLSACASKPTVKQRGRGITALKPVPIPHRIKCPAGKVCKPCPECASAVDKDMSNYDDGTVDVYDSQGNYMGFGETEP